MRRRVSTIRDRSPSRAPPTRSTRCTCRQRYPLISTAQNKRELYIFYIESPSTVFIDNIKLQICLILCHLKHHLQLSTKYHGTRYSNSPAQHQCGDILPCPGHRHVPRATCRPRCSAPHIVHICHSAMSVSAPTFSPARVAPHRKGFCKRRSG